MVHPDEEDTPLQPWQKKLVRWSLNIFLGLSVLAILHAFAEVAFTGGLAWLKLFLAVVVCWIVVQVRSNQDPIRLSVNRFVERWL